MDSGEGLMEGQSQLAESSHVEGKGEDDRAVPEMGGETPRGQTQPREDERVLLSLPSALGSGMEPLVYDSISCTFAGESCSGCHWEGTDTAHPVLTRRDQPSKEI